jgi:hypothetical protein
MRDLLGRHSRRLLLVRFAAALAVPDRARAALVRDAHEGRGRLARAQLDLLQGAARGDRFVLQKRLTTAFDGGVILVLDQQPVGAFPTLLVPAHADQDPAAAQPLAFERELQVAALQTFVRVALGDPDAAVPQLDRAAAILALGNGAFEVAIVERMILDLDGQPLVVRIERRAARHRPGLEHAVELEPEIIVQACRIVALDHEAQALAGRDDRRTRRLGGFLEVALRPVGGEAFLHRQTGGLTSASRSQMRCCLAAAMKESMPFLPSSSITPRSTSGSTAAFASNGAASAE